MLCRPQTQLLQRFLARIHRANKLSTEMDPERFLIYTSTYMVEFRFFIPVLYLELSITLYDYNNRQTSLKFKEKTLMPNDVLSKNVSEWVFFYNYIFCIDEFLQS